MTFSDPKLRALLNDLFVCTWKDLEGDQRAGGSPRIAYGDPAFPSQRGSGYRNLQLVVFTPRGQMIHALSGWVPPADLRWELVQAWVTYDELVANPKNANTRLRKRQSAIQDAFVSKPKRRTPRKSFGIQPGSSEKPFVPTEVSKVERRHAERDRTVVKRHPFADEAKVQTRWFRGGGAAAGFPGDGTPLRSTEDMAQMARQIVPDRRLPMPWSDMSEDLAARVAKALGLEAPPAERKRA